MKSKLNEKFFEYLISLKLIHTKTQNLSSYKLQEYLESENLTYKQKQLLFSLRTRSINVKTNYKSKYKHSNLFCTLCDDKLVESESHLLECKSTLEQLGNIGDARYEDIFSPEISRQEKITKIYEKVLKLRQNFILWYGQDPVAQSLAFSKFWCCAFKIVCIIGLLYIYVKHKWFLELNWNM